MWHNVLEVFNFLFHFRRAKSWPSDSEEILNVDFLAMMELLRLTNLRGDLNAFYIVGYK